MLLKKIKMLPPKKITLLPKVTNLLPILQIAKKICFVYKDEANFCTLEYQQQTYFINELFPKIFETHKFYSLSFVFFLSMWL